MQVAIPGASPDFHNSAASAEKTYLLNEKHRPSLPSSCWLHHNDQQGPGEEHHEPCLQGNPSFAGQLSEEYPSPADQHPSEGFEDSRHLLQ